MTAKILVVEDEEPLAVLLQYNLEAEGYEVETVARGDEADIRLREAPPDLAVLDWMLPGISGIELCRRLRARPLLRTSSWSWGVLATLSTWRSWVQIPSRTLPLPWW